jgi:hypothetical protein
VLGSGVVWVCCALSCFNVLLGIEQLASTSLHTIELSVYVSKEP